MTTGAPSVLIVDDDEGVRALLRESLEINGFLVAAEASDGEEAVKCFAALDPPPSVVVLDERMPRQSGLVTAEQILAIRPNQVVVLFSAALDSELVSRALGIGVQQCVDKLEGARLPQALHVLLGR